MRNKVLRFLGSIRMRMVAIYLVVTLFALFAISFVVSWIVESFLVSQRTESQLQETMRLALEVAPELSSNDAEGIYSLVSERAQSMGGRVLVLDPDAVVQADSASYQNGYMLPYREVRDVLVAGREYSYGFHKISRDGEAAPGWGLGEQYVWAVYYTAPITANGMYVGVVLFSSLIQDVEDSVSDIVNKITLSFFAVAVVITALSFVLSGFVTKPIVELTGAIRRMGKHGYGVRVKEEGVGEVAELSRAFNRMSEQIEAHDRVRDEFVSNASHELKTPLSTMKLLAESILYEDDPDPALMKEFFLDVNHEVDRLSGIITDLLRLVQFDEAENDLVHEKVRLDEIAARIVNRIAPLADPKNIRVELWSEPVEARGEPMRLEQAVMNLVENAVKYTDEGSVSVRVWNDGDEAVLSVADTGIGIPQEAIPHLFERFYRVDKARSRVTGGTGLGLAIVEKIAAMHGGFVDVVSEPGHGSTFTLRLPSADKE